MASTKLRYNLRLPAKACKHCTCLLYRFALLCFKMGAQLPCFKMGARQHAVYLQDTSNNLRRKIRKIVSFTLDNDLL